MQNAHSTRLAPERLPKHLATEHFKVCPVCDALNPRQVEECFVCRWHGEFETNEAHVELALYDLVDSCPSLGDLLVREPPKRSRLVRWLWRLLGRTHGLDIEA